MKQYVVPIVRACKIVGLTRSMWYYQSKKDDTEVMDKLSKLAERYPTRGFDEYYQKIRREGLKWNRKRVLRVYRAMKLSLRRKYKKRIIKRRTIHQLQKLSNQWKNEYNYNHPHKSLGNKSPIEFKSKNN